MYSIAPTDRANKYLIIHIHQVCLGLAIIDFLVVDFDLLTVIIKNTYTVL